MRQAAEPQLSLLDDGVASVAYGDDAPDLPAEDNTPEALQHCWLPTRICAAFRGPRPTMRPPIHCA